MVISYLSELTHTDISNQDIHNSRVIILTVEDDNLLRILM